MTQPRTLMCAHVGGPYDGIDLPVEVDKDGVPVEFNVIADLTSSNMMLDPTTSLQAHRLRALYERDTVISAEGVKFVFRYRNQEVLGNAA